MRYALIRSRDINNGPGICASLYVQGCNHHCKECFNPETWDYNGGKLWTKEKEFQFIEACKNEYVKNICILGGEPLDQGKELFDLLLKLNEEVQKPIWLWTGYVWEDIFTGQNIIIQQNYDEDKAIKRGILNLCSVVIDGPFVEELKDNSLRYRGSLNQRIIDVEETKRNNKVILYRRAY